MQRGNIVAFHQQIEPSEHKLVGLAPFLDESYVTAQ